MNIKRKKLKKKTLTIAPVLFHFVKKSWGRGAKKEKKS